MMTTMAIVMMATMAMVMMATMVMVAGLMMNGGEIEKAADDFTEAEMKPSNMQNMSALPVRMLNTMIMTGLIRMTIMMINGQSHHHE